MQGGSTLENRRIIEGIRQHYGLDLAWKNRLSFPWCFFLHVQFLYNLRVPLFMQLTFFILWWYAVSQLHIHVFNEPQANASRDPQLQRPLHVSNSIPFRPFTHNQKTINKNHRQYIQNLNITKSINQNQKWIAWIIWVRLWVTVVGEEEFRKI